MKDTPMPKKSRIADIIAKMNGLDNVQSNIEILYKSTPAGFQDAVLIFSGTLEGKRVSKRLELNISELADVAAELILNNIKASQIQC